MSANPITAIHPLLAQRQSVKRFDASQSISDEQLDRLLEAARWAPSSRNSQPWRFLPARRQEPAFGRLLGTLSASNRAWAQHAAALILVAAEIADLDGRPRRFAPYDVGGAVAQLTMQAQVEGFGVCQMGGFDAAAAVAKFALPADVQPLVVLAVGAPAAAEAPARLRKPLQELLLPVVEEADLLSA